MERIKTLANIGGLLAIIDFLIRGFGPLYTTAASKFTPTDLIGPAIVPLIAIIVSFSLIKGKKFGLYLGVALVLLSLTATAGVLMGRDSTILPILYLIIYGTLVILGFKDIKKLR